jgi:hypothetical protein
MKTFTRIGFLFAVLLVFSSANPVLADGTETLGVPSISISGGSHFVAGGVGLIQQPGLLEIDVPPGATIRQVLLYWEGHMELDIVGDDTILVNGETIFGTLIGGQTYFFTNSYSSSFRADITQKNFVVPGPNTLIVDGLEFTRANNGAGVIVIYDDDSGAADIEIRDGVDLAYHDFPEPRKNTVPQTYYFSPASIARVAELTLFASSVEDGQHRPNSIEVTVDGVTTIHSDLLHSGDGMEWDTLTLPVEVPANASSVTVQVFSRDDLGSGFNPASLSWIASGLSVPPEPSGGGGEGLTPGFWKQPHHLQYWVNHAPADDYETTFGVDASFEKTLLGALKQGGGGEKALGRHAVAGLLNAAHPDVDYLFTEAEVIQIVQDAYATGDFEAAKKLLEDQNELGGDIKDGGRKKFNAAFKPGARKSARKNHSRSAFTFKP